MTRPLRLLVFAHCSGLAGAERSLLELVAELSADHGVRCTAVLPSEGPLRGRLEEKGAAVRVVEYGWWCRPAPFPLGRSTATLLRALRAEFEGLDPDVVMTISLTIPWGALAAAHLRRPHIWYVHETGRNLNFILPFEHVLDIVDRSSNALLVVSHTARAIFEAVPDEKISVVYPHIPEAEARTRLRTSPTGRSRGRPRFIAPGSIVRHKGQQDAILAVRELAKRGREAELVIMGPGHPQEVARLQKLVLDEGLADRVEIRGFVDEPLGAVAGADIVLVCSRDTALERVVIEALLLEKPVVAARSGGPIELCQEGANGLLYAPGDPADLASRSNCSLPTLSAQPHAPATVAIGSDGR